MAAVSEPLLTLDRVTASLGGRTIVRGADLEIRAGEFTALLGPNGAGKTTLLRSILGTIPSTGTITVNGKPISRKNRPGYVPQHHSFAWDFPVTVSTAVMTGLPRRLLRPVEHYRAVDRALAHVHLADFADRPVGALSGGQKQRVLVARALVGGADVLLLDEPFTGVDMPTQEFLTDVFTDLARSGTAIFMSTHDLPAALRTCSHCVLFDGTVRAHGATEDIRSRELWADVFGIDATSSLLEAV